MTTPTAKETRPASELDQLRAKQRRLERDPLTRNTMLAAVTAARIRELENTATVDTPTDTERSS